MDLLKVFLVGGAICAIVQIFMEKTKLMPGRIMVILVCLGSLLGALGIYKSFSEWAKAGATIPLIGFGNTLYEGVKESIDKEGFIGLFKGGLTNTSVGISSALIFGYIASILFNPKIKN